MKILIFLAFIFQAMTAFASPGIYRDPGEAVTPWPLEIGRQAINVHSLNGVWTSPAGSDSRWILVNTAWDERSYHWEMYLSSSASLRSEGIVYLKDQYVIGLIQSPFAETEFVVMYLMDGQLRMKIGGRQSPRVAVVFDKKTNEF
jgi:hypothetical protein